MTAVTNQLLDIDEERKLEYVQACQNLASKEDVNLGIKYLNKQPEGILAYREAGKLKTAIEHIQRMREKGRVDTSGLPCDYSHKELFYHVKKTSYMSIKKKDVRRAIKECQKKGFSPCPEECIETIKNLKDELEMALVQEKQKSKRTEEQRVEAEKQRKKEEKRRQNSERQQKDLSVSNDALKQQLEQNEQKIKTVQKQLQKKNQTNQQLDEQLKDKNLTIRQLQEDRQCPEGEWEKRYKEAKQEKEEELKKFQCLICTTAYVDVAFHPCNHLICCKECAKKFSLCPMCKKDIRQPSKLYTQWN